MQSDTNDWGLHRAAADDSNMAKMDIRTDNDSICWNLLYPSTFFLLIIKQRDQPARKLWVLVGQYSKNTQGSRFQSLSWLQNCQVFGQLLPSNIFLCPCKSDWWTFRCRPVNNYPYQCKDKPLLSSYKNESWDHLKIVCKALFKNKCHCCPQKGTNCLPEIRCWNTVTTLWENTTQMAGTTARNSVSQSLWIKIFKMVSLPRGIPVVQSMQRMTQNFLAKNGKKELEGHSPDLFF